jgi:DNA invertase Pin-like site-specific DNA recombinase
MNLGYARTSTIEQEAGLEAQQRDLRAAGVDKMFVEQVSSVAARAQLELALDYLRDGDMLTVTKLDRLARLISDLCAIIKRIEAKGASLRILGMGLDTSTASGRLMLNVLGSVAQFEREVMLERQREGIAKAKGEGKYLGRKPTARAKADEIRRLAADGATRESISAQTRAARGRHWAGGGAFEPLVESLKRKYDSPYSLARWRDRTCDHERARCGDAAANDLDCGDCFCQRGEKRFSLLDDNVGRSLGYPRLQGGEMRIALGQLRAHGDGCSVGGRGCSAGGGDSGLDLCAAHNVSDRSGRAVVGLGPAEHCELLGLIESS